MTMTTYETEQHLLVQIDGDQCAVSISQQGLDEMGEITYFEASCYQFQHLRAGDAVADIESRKAAITLVTPVAMEVAWVTDRRDDIQAGETIVRGRVTE